MVYTSDITVENALGSSIDDETASSTLVVF